MITFGDSPSHLHLKCVIVFLKLLKILLIHINMGLKPVSQTWLSLSQDYALVEF